LKKVTFIEAITMALAEEMERDERVFLIGEDIGAYGGVFKATKGLQERFGSMRVIDSPISEAFIAGGSVGAALMGMRAVCRLYNPSYGSNNTAGCKTAISLRR